MLDMMDSKFYMPSLAKSHQTSKLSTKSRQQHTLDSIGSERSRSRNPIVVAAMPRRIEQNEYDLKSFSNSTTTFASGNRGSNTNGSSLHINSGEDISTQSFERRRSIYERDAGLNIDHRAVEDHSSSDISGAAQILNGFETAKRCEILKPPDDIRVPVQTTSSIAEASEMQEFKRMDELSQMTYSTSEISLSDSSNSTSKQPNENAFDKRIDLSSNGFEIVWLNFTYSVEPNIFEDPRWGRVNSLFHKESRMILKGLSGGLKSGEMIALMGPSGTGKTCLLECIAGLRRTGIGGKLYLRGRRRAELSIVPQHDDFLPQFSVEEIINYGSKMKNPPNTDHRAVTNYVIKQLGLDGCRKTNIQMCSGGQRKRVAIAQELVSRPNILILDEPTSGLDSSCCCQTVKVLREVLNQSMETGEPMAIVTTIHQPSAKVFKMFDLVYLLSKTGYVAYSGLPSNLLTTIKELTGLECPQYSNPADYMIELVSYDYGEEPVEKLVAHEKKKAARFEADYELRAGEKGRVYAEDQQNQWKGQVRYKDNVSIPLRKATSSDDRRHPFFWHTFVHIQRSYLQSIRDPIMNNMRILIHLVFASMIVLLYGDKSGEARGCPPVLGLPPEITDPDNENIIDLSDNVGYLFMCVMLITYVSLMSTVLTFPVDIKTVGKEYKNGWYGTLTYFIGKSIADLPFIIGYPMAYCIITWYSTHQAPGSPWRFSFFTGLIIMNAMNSQSFGLILGALFMNSVAAATFLGPIITIPWYLFTGFTKRVHRLHPPLRICSNLLFTRFVFEGILDTVYGHQRCNCSHYLEQYYELRYKETLRLGELISVETLSSLDYYDGLESVARNLSNKSAISTGGHWLADTVETASTFFSEDLNLAGLVESNGKASSLFSFGLDFEPTCPPDYRAYVVQDFRLGENSDQNALVTTIIMLAVNRFITFLIVSWKIRAQHL